MLWITFGTKKIMALSYALNIPSQEEQPVYKLSERLTIGSEQGELILDDPSIDSKHCTFLVNDDVVSVIDHNSAMGTFVGDERIPSDKMVILVKGDRLKIGDVDVELTAQDLGGDKDANVLLYTLGSANSEAKSVEQLIIDQIIGDAQSSTGNMDELFSKADEPTRVVNMNQTQEFEMNEPSQTQSIPKEISREDQIEETSDEEDEELDKEEIKEQEHQIREQVFYRISAFFIEIFIAYSLNSLYLRDIINPITIELVELGNSIPGLGLFIGEMQTYFNLFITYSILRILSSSLLGVSYIQLLLGFYSVEESKSARFLRELMGFFIGPFLFGDIFLIQGKYSLKERVSKSYVLLRDKKKAVVYSIILFPLLLMVALVSPLFYGFEIPQGYSVNKVIAKKTTTAESYVSSHVLGLRINHKFDEQNLLVPIYSLSGSMEDYYLKGVHQKGVKTFSLKLKKMKFLFQVIKDVSIHDPLFRLQYPTLNRVINQGYKNRMAAEQEVVDFLVSSFELGLYSSIDHITTLGPFLTSYLELRKKVLDELSIKELTSLDLVNIQGKKFLSFVSQVGEKGSQQILLPLSLTNSDGYQLSSREMLPSELSRIGVVLWSKSKVIPKVDFTQLQIQFDGAFAILDYLKQAKSKKGELSTNLIDYYTVLKRKILDGNNQESKRVFNQSLNSMLTFLENYKKKNPSLLQTDVIINQIKELKINE